MDLLIGGETFESIVLFLLYVFAIVVLGNIIYSIFRYFFEKKFSKRVAKTIAKIIQYSFLIVALYFGLNNILKLNLTAIAASLGVIGIVVAFSAQQIMQNVLAGIMIAIQRPIRLEDWITVSFPDTGINRVKDIGLTSTILEDKDGKTIYIPNSVLISTKVINYSKMDFVQVPIDFNLKIKSFEKAKKIILSVVKNHKKILPNVSKKEKFAIDNLLHLNSLSIKDDKFKPQILIHDVSDESINVTLTIWILDIQSKELVVSQVLEKVLEKFKQEKIIK